MASKHKKIFVVDDDPGVLHLLGKRLPAAHGYEVVTAQGAAEALRMIRRDPPDLILLDVIMPGQSGGDLARDLQKQETTRDIPIVFLTVLLDEKVKGKQRMSVGGKEFRAVAKPIHMPQLLSTLRKALNESANR
ncbi:MAG: response regulator [Candidatus Omnitrophota bacterium]